MKNEKSRENTEDEDDMIPKILIVDDDPIMANLLETRLSDAGFETGYTRSNRDISEQIHQSSPELILIGMPLADTDEKKLCDQIHQAAQAYDRSIPILFICPDTLESLPDCGDGCIIKPFMMDKLIETVHSLLKKPSKKPLPPPVSQKSCRTNNSAPSNCLLECLKQAEQDGFSGVLDISGCPATAAVYFKNGAVIHAVHGITSGKKALYRIFAETAITVRFRHQDTDVFTIDEPLRWLIREGYEEVEAMKRLKPETFETRLKIIAESVDIPQLSLQHTLSLTKQFRRVKDILDTSSLTDLQTYKHLVYLIKKGLIAIDSTPVSQPIPQVPTPPEPVSEKKQPVETAFSVPPTLELVSEEDSKKPVQEAETDQTLTIEIVKESRMIKEGGIQVITDSSADLPPEIIRKYSITVMPLQITIGGKIYKEGTHIFPEKIYDRLQSSKTPPVVSPPSENDFYNQFHSLCLESDILAILSSKKLNQAVDHAVAAKNNHFKEYLTRREQTKIEIIDSRLISLGLGLLVVEAAQKILNGWTLERIHAYVQSLIPIVRVFFMAGRLDYYKGGGRVGRAGLWIGNLLGITQILSIHNGEILPVDESVGKSNARHLIVDIIRQQLRDPETPIKIGVGHADAEKSAEDMLNLLETHLNCQEVMTSYIGPTVSVHYGVGTIGVACLPIIHKEGVTSVWK